MLPADMGGNEGEEIELWTRLRTGDAAGVRDALIDRYSGFARMLAAKLYADRHLKEIEFDEYYQYALVGLVESVDRFQHDRGASFKTYAAHRIRGAVLNGIEKYSEKQQQIVSRKRLREERFKSMLEAAGTANTDPFLTLVDTAIGAAIGFMLEDSALYQAEETTYEHNVYRSHELADLTRTLDALVDTLPEQEQAVIRTHYFQQIRFEDIAIGMGVTKGRVSQIHHKALRRLREHYEQLRLLRTDY